MSHTRFSHARCMQRVTTCIHSRKKNTCEYAKESTILIVAVEGRTGMALLCMHNL